MTRSNITSVLALGLLLPFGWIELQTYHGEANSLVHMFKFIVIVASISVLLAQTKWISNEWMMSIVAPFAVLVVATAEYEFWKQGKAFDIRTVSEHGLNIFIFVIVGIFAVLAIIDRWQRRHLP
jgi:hypothetical protein